ncbi:MAG: ArnT family glycosyltransferase [Nitrospirota bacterium]
MMFAIERDPIPAGQAGEAPDFQYGKKDYYAILALRVLCLVLFFYQLGSHPLWDVDEGLHASTSKGMVLSGDWVTTRVNGQNFYDKTVLHNWFVAVSFLLFSFTELAARLPAALLGLGTVLVTYELGRRMFGARAVLLGGAVLATSPEFIILSRSVVHDISLAFFITLSFAFFFIAFSTSNRRKPTLFLFYASLGLAVLAKGPIGLLLITVYVLQMDPYRSTRMLAKEMDIALPPGDPIVCFRRLWDTTLFYTNRRAIVLHSDGQLIDYLSSNKTTLCIIERDQFAKFLRIAAASRIVNEEGNRLLISGKPALPAFLKENR